MATPVPFFTQYERFLIAEQGATGNLVGMYAQTRAELTAFLMLPPVPLTASEQAFFGALQGEVDRLSREATTKAASWVEQSIPQAFVEGALQHSPEMTFTTIHDAAVRALSGYNLALITQMNEGMRSVVRQQIGVGLLEGATRQQISDRLTRSGLTNIPHWRSVEERAAVIARTEIMRSYNAGNLAGILDSGAVVVRWITGRDEFTCPTCRPRHNQKYALAKRDANGDEVPYPPLPGGPPPAHPRCRCTIRASFFDDEEGIVPVAPPGGIIASTPTPEGPRTSDFDTLFDRTKLKQYPTTADYNAAGLAWKDAALDEARLRRIATEFDDDAYAFVVGGRYGVQFRAVELGAKTGRAAKTWADPEFRYRLLQAIERVRAVTPRYAVGSPYFTELQLVTRKVIRKRGVLADCSPTGRIRINMSTSPDYLTKQLRSGANGIEEIMVHELGHAIHNRYGFAGFGFQPIEEMVNGIQYGVAYARWNEIRAATARAVYSPGQLDTLKAIVARHEESLAVFDSAVAEWDTLERVVVTKRVWNWATGLLEDAQVEMRVTHDQFGRLYQYRSADDIAFDRRRALEAYERAKGQLVIYEEATDLLPTTYASDSMKEDFAESLMLYLLDPATLEAASPARFAYMRDVIFAQ